MNGKSLYGENNSFRCRAFFVGESMVIYFSDPKAFLQALEISLHVLYPLRLPMEALDPTREHQVGKMMRQRAP